MASRPAGKSAPIAYCHGVSTPAWRERARDLRDWLGIPGLVLLVALLFDVLVVVANLTAGSVRAELFPLLGIFAFVACGFAAPRRPIPAALLGAAVLAGSGYLLFELDIGVFSVFIAGISTSQTVAGVLLVYYCAARVAPLRATIAIVALVGAGLVALLGETERASSGGRSDLVSSLLFGALALIAPLIAVWQYRSADAPANSGKVGALIGRQWPLIGMLSFVYFAELSSSVDELSPWNASILLLSGLACVAAVLATVQPVRSGYALAAIIPASSVLQVGLGVEQSGMTTHGVRLAQIVAGLVVVTYLVRGATPLVAIRQITLMSAGVAAAVLFAMASRGLPAAPDFLPQIILQAMFALGGAVAVGLYFRARDSERNKSVVAAVRDAQHAERMALARELHDVVAHQVTGIVVQAQAAKHVADSRPEAAAQALDRIEESGLAALTAMRRLVGSMRGEASGAGSASADTAMEEASTDFAGDLRDLVEQWQRDSGTRVELTAELGLPVPPEVSRSALRLVQESLTNTGKHAAGVTAVRILASCSDSELHLRVHDDGRATKDAPVGGSGGYGIVGMAERVELLGGLFTAGPATGGGWQVEAWLPRTEGQR
ncbi:signal transduction histidine kinase [Tamaricihabitans halophyticus]|uniref:histidine kinase n=2 Tax=Tamaricihabitans halophyticus TaxID=1262583 RepID=A0A4R2QVI2_9PSEU|nr:signal transduction histidine kinase [Tamaricihabitans halophyticus]